LWSVCGVALGRSMVLLSFGDPLRLGRFDRSAVRLLGFWVLCSACWFSPCRWILCGPAGRSAAGWLLVVFAAGPHGRRGIVWGRVRMVDCAGWGAIWGFFAPERFWAALGCRWPVSWYPCVGSVGAAWSALCGGVFAGWFASGWGWFLSLALRPVGACACAALPACFFLPGIVLFVPDAVARPCFLVFAWRFVRAVHALDGLPGLAWGYGCYMALSVRCFSCFARRGRSAPGVVCGSVCSRALVEIVTYAPSARPAV